MIDVKQMKKFVTIIACDIASCQCVFMLVSGVNIPNLNFGVQIHSVKQPFKFNSVGSGNMSHCWTSDFDDHFNHGFVILKDAQHRTKLRKLRVRRDTVSIAQTKIVVLIWNVGCVLVCLLDVCYATSFLVLDLWCCWVRLVKNDTLLPPNPKDQELEFHPCLNLHREKLFHLQ